MIRVYGHTTREISLLPREHKSFRQASQAVRYLQKNLECLEEAERKKAQAYRSRAAQSHLERHTIAHEKKYLHVSCNAIAARYANAMRAVAQKPYAVSALLQGPYALVGDGLYFKFKRREWVMYLMAVKSAGSKKAYFLDPVLLEGRECYERWVQAIATTPLNIKKRICAFVSDGFRGSQPLSEQNR